MTKLPVSPSSLLPPVLEGINGSSIVRTPSQLSSLHPLHFTPRRSRFVYSPDSDSQALSTPSPPCYSEPIRAWLPLRLTSSTLSITRHPLTITEPQSLSSSAMEDLERPSSSFPAPFTLSTPRSTSLIIRRTWRRKVTQLSSRETKRFSKLAERRKLVPSKCSICRELRSNVYT